MAIGEVTVGGHARHLAHENGQEKIGEKAMNSRQSEHDRWSGVAQDHKVHGERLHGEVEVMEKDNRKILERGEFVAALKRVYFT